VDSTSSGDASAAVVPPPLRMVKTIADNFSTEELHGELADHD
jgi:hypothetical protein